VFLFDLDKKGVSLAAALPIYVDDNFCVRWAKGERGKEIIRRLEKLSKHLGNGHFAREFWRQRLERNTGLVLKVVWFHFRRGNWAILLSLVKRIRLIHLGMFLGWIFQVSFSRSIRSFFSRPT
jgi:hypothetical protein